MSTEGKKLAASADGLSFEGNSNTPTTINSENTMTETSTYDDEAASLPEEPAPMPAELQGHIGKHLRTVYGALVREPVPDKFMVLLQQLADKERRENKS